MWMVVIQKVFEGMTVVGPFPDEKAAVAWGAATLNIPGLHVPINWKPKMVEPPDRYQP